MKKTSTIIVLLALLAIKTVKSYDDEGLNYTLTDTNDDPNSCIVNLTLTLSPNKITFQATTVSDTAQDCTHHDLQLWSYFRGDQLNANVPLIQNGNVASGDLTLDMIKNYNGTACMYSGFNVSTSNHYECQVKYNNIHIIVVFGLDNATGNIDTTWTGLWNPIAGATIQVMKEGYNIWKPNNTFPQVVGMASTSCGSQYNNRITDLNQEIFLTGTDSASNNIDFHNYFSDYTIIVFWVRPTINTSNATNLPYSTFFIPNDWFAFQTDQGVCYDMGVKYGNFLPNITYCQNGCAVTGNFLKQVNATYSIVYPAPSNGVFSGPARLLRA